MVRDQPKAGANTQHQSKQFHSKFIQQKIPDQPKADQGFFKRLSLD
jgi:hypothetical protein